MTATRDMIYDKLKGFAVRELEQTLNTLGVSLKLNQPVTIRSIQKQLIARQARATGVTAETYKAAFVIEGDTVHVNGKPFKIQRRASGADRIRSGGAWLTLDAIREFCK